MKTNKLNKLFILFLIWVFFLSGIIYADDIDFEIDSSIETISPQDTLPSINSRAAIVYDRNSGMILYGKNENEKRKMASTTKILTAIITIENSTLSDIVTISSKSAGTGGSRLGLHKDDKISVADLLYGLMLCSGNDAAVALAEHISGSVENFAILMNQKACEIGLNSSHFVTPHGLDDDNHYTTAYDLALIMKQCIKNDVFKKILLTDKCTLPATELNSEERIFQNNNSLIEKGDKYYYQYCKGGKTGYTKEAKNCLVSYASKDGMDLIAVVLKGETTETGESARNRDTINLFEYGYNNYNLQTIKKKDETVTSVEVKDNEGNTKQLKVKLENDIAVVNKDENKTQKDIKPEIDVNVENAPIEKGEVVGTATYKINGEEYTSNLLIFVCNIFIMSVIFVVLRLNCNYIR